MLSISRYLLISLYFLGVLLFAAWGVLALHFDSGDGILIQVLFLIAVACTCFFPSWKKRVLSFATIVVVILGWWFSQSPSNDRSWQADVSKLPAAQIEGNILQIDNVRNFQYRSETDFTPNWESHQYDLSQIKGADLFLSDWGAPGIAHTIMSWEFADGQHLAISIETRKEVGEVYSAIGGFFRQYELYYVVADERDVIGVRARFRGEKLTLYRLSAPPERARALLLSYIKNINGLVAHPKWYNAFFANCTTSIRTNVENAGGMIPLDWRLFANQHIDELLYEKGKINTSLPLAELRNKSNITELAKSAKDTDDFANFIREGLPERPKSGKGRQPS